jgi:hypothetical protein
MKQQNWWKILLAFTAFAAIAGAFAIVWADDQKEIPDHTSFKSCQPCHAEIQKMWEESGHSKAISRVAGSSQTSADCYGCHSTEGFSARLQGNKIDTGDKQNFHTVSCLACHDLRDSKLPHMTEGNHRMRVLRPDDPGLDEKRVDTCTGCHKDNNREARARQIQEYQSEYEEKMAPLQADVEAVSAALKEKPDVLKDAMKQKFGDVKFNLSILTRDGSRGFHNFDYALEIMALASSDLKEIKADLK